MGHLAILALPWQTCSHSVLDARACPELDGLDCTHNVVEAVPRVRGILPILSVYGMERRIISQNAMDADCAIEDCAYPSFCCYQKGEPTLGGFAPRPIPSGILDWSDIIRRLGRKDTLTQAVFRQVG